MTDEIAYAALAVSILATVPLYIDLFNRSRASRRIDFELEQYIEVSGSRGEDWTGVRILHPTKSIEHCSVFLNGKPLPFVDSPYTELLYERKVPKGGGENVMIPNDLWVEGAWVIVKDGKKTLKKMLLSDIPDTGPQ